MLILTVKPSRNPEGGRAWSGRGQLFDGVVESRIIVHPLLDGCRALLAAGVDPTTPIVMRHDGSAIDSLTSTVGTAAGLTVWEADKPPRLGSWMPRNYVAEGSPMRQTDEAATPVA